MMACADIGPKLLPKENNPFCARPLAKLDETTMTSRNAKYTLGEMFVHITVDSARRTNTATLMIRKHEILYVYLAPFCSADIASVVANVATVLTTRIDGRKFFRTTGSCM